MKNWSKFSRRCCFRRITASFLVFCIFFSTTAPLLVAGPEGAQVVNGEVTFDQNGNYTTITASDQSIVNYSSFNIGSPETVQFIQPSSQASILNRILSANPTMIDGTLLANGRVFFINPAGVMIGGSAKINVNQLVASGLNMSNSSFLAGQYEFVGGDGTVSNSGQISAESVYLVGKQVINAGQIDCPDGYVIMGAGDKIYLNRTGSSIVVEVDTVAPVSGQPAIDAGITNTGSVNADGGEIFLAVAGDVLARPLLANAGMLSAKGGSVTLAADEVINTGTIDVSDTTGGSVVIEAADRASQLGTVNADGITGDGGTINITADESVVLGSGSVTTANAGANGDGGEIIVYSAGKAVLADGAIAEAKGGTESGDGGFMELSGLESIELNSIVDLSAPAGLAGTLLLDPLDVWISNVSPGTEGTSWIDAVLLGNQLNIGFISLNTDGDWGSPGDITVADSVSWASLYGLELSAYRNISVNAGITNTGAGHLTLDARGDIVVNAPISLNGGHLAMFAAEMYETSGIQINDDITAGSMRLKTGWDDYVTEQWFSRVFVGDGAKLETVKVNESSGDIVIEAVHNVILGSGDEIDGVVVDAAGQVYINADQDGWGDPLSEQYSWHYKGGDLLAEGTIIARDGGVTLKGNAMELGNVTAGNGNLAITGRTSSEYAELENVARLYSEVSEVVAGYENGWGNIAVAADKILSADGNLDIIDAQADYANGEYDGQMKLTGETKLTLEALGGKITSEHTAIGVTGSTLVMEQLDTLDTKDYTFFNQNTTNLELTSTGGAVISTTTADGGLDENSADQWESIGAQAYDNDGLAYAIHLSGNSVRDIKTTLLDAVNDDIKVDSAQEDILATAAVTAHNGSIELEAGDGLTINKAVYASGTMMLTAEADGTGDGDVVANDTLTTRDGNMDIEGRNVYLYDVADSGGDMTITALPDYPYPYYDGGTVEVHGLVADGSIDITGNDTTIHIYKSADISALADVDAGVDIKLNSDTEATEGVILDAGRDVILADGKTLNGDHELTIIAGNEIKAQNATIEVSGSLLTLQQAVDLNLSNFILGNQADTDLTLISTDGSVISDLDKPANSADKWLKITATAADDITLIGENSYAGLPNGIRVGDLNAGTDGTGSISIKDIGQDGVDDQGDGDDGTIYAYGNMTAGTDVTLHNNTELDGGNQRIEATNGKLTTEGTVHKTSSGNLDMLGGYNVQDWPTSSVWAQEDITVDDGKLTIRGNANVRLDGSIYSSGDMELAANHDGDGSKGMLVHYGDTIKSLSGDVDLSAKNDVIYLDGGNALEYVTAGDDILIRDHTWVQYSRKLEAGDDVVLAGGESIVSTNALHGGNLTVVAGDDIILGVSNVDTHETTAHIGTPGNVTTSHNMVLDAGDDIYAHGDLVSNEGSVELYSSDDTTYLGGDVTAFVDVLLNNNTQFTSTDDQHVTAQTGSVTANGWLKKVTEGHLLLSGGASGVGIDAVSLNGIDPYGVSASTYAGNLEIHGVGDVQISGDLTTFGVVTSEEIRVVEEVTVSNGGVSIISDEGKIYTDGASIGNDTLNVNITGNSDHKAEPSLGVDLPKNYDVEVETTGKAAIVIMSEDELKLGPDGTLTAEGTYYDDGSVDDRPSVDFLDHDILADDKLGGIPIDIAIFLASNGGSVDVGSPTADLPDGAAMVADAYETVTFGTAFEDSLVDGNVDWLEVTSRMSTSWDVVWNSGDTRLPYVGPDGMEILPWSTPYILRIENLDVGTGTWILGEDDDDSQTLPIEDLTRASLIVPPTPPEIIGIGPIEGFDNLTWLVEELGLCTGDEKDNDENRCQEMQLYMAGVFMQSSDIQPHEAATRLRELAATLHDSDGSHIAALGKVVNEFANPDLPPSPEMMTSIMTAFDAHTNDGTHYASAAQWLEAMTEYVVILNSDIGWDMDKSVAFIMGKYGSGITESGQVSVIAFVQIHLENIGG